MFAMVALTTYLIKNQVFKPRHFNKGCRWQTDGSRLGDRPVETTRLGRAHAFRGTVSARSSGIVALPGPIDMNGIRIDRYERNTERSLLHPRPGRSALRDPFFSRDVLSRKGSRAANSASDSSVLSL
jgi:hypothetical protein